MSKLFGGVPPAAELGKNPLEHLSTRDIKKLVANLHKFEPEEAKEIEQLVDELIYRRRRDKAQTDLISFAKAMMSDYKVGKHHKRLAALLQDIESGKRDRITVSVAPRHGKSQLVSIFFCAWYLGKNPTHKVILASHTADLAVDFGRKVRNLINSAVYQRIFPDVSLAADSKSAGRWNTNHEGEFFATGVGSALAGRGAHLLLIDDPHSEQDILAGNYEVFDKAYMWFTSGARTRLMPKGKIAIVATRWHQDDLIGKVITDMAKDPTADQYEVFEFPAIIEVEREGEIVKKALWPEFFDIGELLRTKATMPAFQWNAQYMQNPTGEEQALIKRTWWRRWRHEKPPKCDFIIMSLDAAAEKNTRADYTSLTTWGVFFNEEEEMNQLILLNAIKDRYEFPELKNLCLEEYYDWEPDSFIVEKKSAGAALYQEMRRSGIPVQEYTPHRGSGDKYARLSSVSDIVSSGMVWVPEYRWAEDLVEEIASFPVGRYDDQVDSTVMALMRFRQGGFLRLPSDEPEPINLFKGRGRSRRRFY